MVYKPQGVCSNTINIEVEGDIIKHVSFVGGCNGNLQGISSLVTGMKTEVHPVRINWLVHLSRLQQVRTKQYIYFQEAF